MAALCPSSLRQMERFFSDHFHKTPRQWTKELRCRLAKQLIERGYSSRAVVEELGFKDHAHLCHVFKQVYGVAPQDVGPTFR
jgi:transcriptional regulator GlxA family with amidase domain